MAYNKPPNPDHISGMMRGEEVTLSKSGEPGGERNFCRNERDSMRMNAEAGKLVMCNLHAA